MKISTRGLIFGVVLILLHILFLVLYITLAEYGYYYFPAWYLVTILPNENSIFQGDFPDRESALRTAQKLQINNMFPPDEIIYTQLWNESLTNSTLDDYPYDRWQPLNVMLFVGFALYLSSLKCSSFLGAGLALLIIALSFLWGALVYPWIMQAASGIPNPETVYYNVILITDILYGCFAMLVAYSAIIGRSSRIQIVWITFIGIILYSVTRVVVVYYLATLDYSGTISVFLFGSSYGIGISIMLDIFYKKKICLKNYCHVFSGYFENFAGFIGTLVLIAYWPSFCTYIFSHSLEIYNRAVVNSFFAIMSGILTVFALGTIFGSCQKLGIGLLHKVTLAACVAIASNAPTRMEVWGAVLSGFAAALFSITCEVYIQPFLSKNSFIDSNGALSAFLLPSFIGGIISIIVAACALDPMTYTTLELKLLYPAIIYPHGPGSPRSGGTQAGYQAASMTVAIGIGLIGGILVGLIARLLGPLCEETIYNDNSVFVMPYNCGSPCNKVKAQDQNICQDIQC